MDFYTDKCWYNEQGNNTQRYLNLVLNIAKPAHVLFYCMTFEIKHYSKDDSNEKVILSSNEEYQVLISHSTFKSPNNLPENKSHEFKDPTNKEVKLKKSIWSSFSFWKLQFLLLLSILLTPLTQAALCNSSALEIPVTSIGRTGQYGHATLNLGNVFD